MIILRKEDSFSNSIKDGKLIYEGSDEKYTDFNLENNKIYYYTIYAYDSTLNYSKSATTTTRAIEGKITFQPQIQKEPKEVQTIKSKIPKDYFKRALIIGAEGEDVRKLQELLASDPELYPEGLVTGYFGSLVQEAIKKFQCKYNIVCGGSPETTGYGIVGSKTRQKLNEIYGGEIIEESSPESLANEEKTRQLKEQIRQLNLQIIQILNKIIELLQENIERKAMKNIRIYE